MKMLADISSFPLNDLGNWKYTIRVQFKKSATCPVLLMHTNGNFMVAFINADA
jgi:hypothetical protein